MSEVPGTLHGGKREPPIAIRECEFSALPEFLPIGQPHVGARVLARWHGTPVAWLHFGASPGGIRGDDLVAALTTQQATTFNTTALHERLQPVRVLAATPPMSVVVCTRNRTDSLDRCLVSLAALTYPEYEVVVVDNAPDNDDAEALVRSRAADWPWLRYVREPRPGLDWARNRGLEAARFGIVAYTDDDVRVDRLWLHGVARGFREAEVVLVTGLVAPAELETDAQIVFEDWYGGMGKGLRARRWDPAALQSVHRLGAHHLGVGANMAFRREWLQQLNGFDTALDVGTPSHGAGDLDVFHRTLAAGGATRYEPSAIVWHYHRRDFAALGRQLTDNGRAFGVYLLTRARHEPSRLGVLRYAVGTWLRWLVMRVPRRLLRRESMPLPLQAREWLGVLQAPFAWIATYRNDARVRAAYRGSTPPR